MSLQKITPFLWFDGQAEEAVNFYVSIFKNSKIGEVARYSEAGQEVHGQKPGTVMTMSFELEGQKFIALNGGSHFRFNEAISFVINCDSQQEVDHYWNRLSEGGDEKAQQCGWLKDRYGISWQVIPTILPRLLGDPDPGTANRVMSAMLQMKKIDIAALERAATGRSNGTN
jgi:predicted 3-demethylubiquinone-9 3-methyltransferase (glyoxalase superfamily)